MAVCIGSDLDTEDLLRQLEVNRELQILAAEVFAKTERLSSAATIPLGATDRQSFPPDS